MTQEKKSGMALWLKITIAIVGLGCLSGLVLLIIGGIFIADSAQKAMDPKHVAQVADSIAKIDDPLPAGFTRVTAVDVMGMSEVAFANTREGLTVVFMKMQKTGKAMPADYLVDNYCKSGAPSSINAGGLGAVRAPMVIESRGKMTVGGEQMPYAIGCREINGIKVLQMIGCVVPASTGRSVLVFGQCSRTSAYKLDVTKNLLAAVKGF